MTDTEDIIGITKELQQVQMALRAKYPHPTEEAWDAFRPLIARLLVYFPLIALSLLDAVEALEEIQQEANTSATKEVKEKRNVYALNQFMNIRACADQALSRIRSQPIK